MTSTQWWLTPLHLMLSQLSPHRNAAMGEKAVGAPPGGSAAKKKVVTFESISVTILRGGKIRSSSSLHNAGKY